MIFKLVAAVIKLLNKFGLFKAIGFIFKAIGKTLSAIFDVINWIVEKITVVIDYITEFMNKHPIIAKILSGGWSESGGGASAVTPVSSQSTTNNKTVNNNANVTINTQNFNPNDGKAVMNYIIGRIAESSKNA